MARHSARSVLSAPGSLKGAMRTLWRATMRIGTAKEAFYFRESENFTAAAVTASRLLEESLSARMVGAEIVAVEREARLWN